jgi:NAD kinase
MTPKEKAIELVEMYYETLTYLESKSKAKQCALIAVDELIETEYQSVNKLLNIIKDNKIRLVISFNSDYWQEVKQEINKL